MPLASGRESRSHWESALYNAPLSNACPTHDQNSVGTSAWLSGAQLRLIASGLTDARGKSAREQSPTVLGTIRAVGSEGLPCSAQPVCCHPAPLFCLPCAGPSACLCPPPPAPAAVGCCSTTPCAASAVGGSRRVRCLRCHQLIGREQCRLHGKGRNFSHTCRKSELSGVEPPGKWGGAPWLLPPC